MSLDDTSGLHFTGPVIPQANRAAIQEYRFRSSLSLDQAASVAEGHLRNIERDRQFLIEQMASNRNTIYKRWQSLRRREKYLEIADPVIFMRLSEHLWSFFGENTGDGEERASLLTPSLYLEALESDPYTFLALLHNRTKYSPQDLAAQDSQEVSFVWNNKLIPLDYSKSLICMVGENYGEVQAWDELSVHRSTHMAFSRGILVLEAQENIYSCLRKTVEAILDETLLETADDNDIDPDDDINSDDTDSDDTDADNAWIRGSNRFGNILATYFSGVFSEPIAIDFDLLKWTAELVLSANTDKIALFQSNPMALRKWVDRIGQCDAVHHSSTANIKYVIAFDELQDDIVDAIMWRTILNRLKNLEVSSEKLFKSPQNGGLEHEFHSELAVLELLLIRYFQYSGRHALDSLRHYYGLEYLFSSTCTEVCRKGLTKLQYTGIKPNHTWVEAFTTDRREWCLSQMLLWEPVYTEHDPDGSKFNGHVDFGTLVSTMTAFFRFEKESNQSLFTIQHRWAFAKHISIHHLLETIRSLKPQFDSCEFEVNNKNVVTRVKGLEKVPVELNPGELHKRLEASSLVSMREVLTNMAIFDKWPTESALDKVWQSIRARNIPKITSLGFDSDFIVTLLSASAGPADSKSKKRKKAKAKSAGHVPEKELPQQDQRSQQDGPLGQDEPLGQEDSLEHDEKASLPLRVSKDNEAGILPQLGPDSTPHTLASAPDYSSPDLVPEEPLPESDYESDIQGDLQPVLPTPLTPKLRRREKKKAKEARRRGPIDLLDLGEASASTPDSAPISENYQIFVPKAAFQILTNMLPPQLAHFSAYWDDFQRAMKHAGFEVINQQGAAITFQSKEAEKLQLPSKVTIHRPHRNEIPPHIARNYGKTLRDTLGWDKDLFVLEKNLKGVQTSIRPP